MRLLLLAILAQTAWGQCVDIITVQSLVIVTPSTASSTAPSTALSNAPPSASAPSAPISPPGTPRTMSTLSQSSPPLTAAPSAPPKIISTTSSMESRRCNCTNTLKTMTRIIPIPLIRSRTVTRISMITSNAMVRFPGTFTDHAVAPPPQTVISEFQSIFTLMRATTACDPSQLCIRVCPGHEELHDGAYDIMPGHRCCRDSK